MNLCLDTCRVLVLKLDLEAVVDAKKYYVQEMECAGGFSLPPAKMQSRRT